MRLRLFLPFISALAIGNSFAANSDLDDLLSIPPTERLIQAIDAGDIRLMAVPECSASMPIYKFPDSPYAKGAPIELDPTCSYIFGEDGMVRLKRLEVYANEFNKLMLAHMTETGMLPMYPTDAAPYQEATPAENDAMRTRATSVLEALFGSPSPEISSITLWKTFGGKDSRLFVEASLTPYAFNKNFPVSAWREIPIPVEALEPMHLPRNVPKKYMTCFFGRIDSLPAYVFWSEATGYILIQVAYDGAKPIKPN